MEKLKVFISSTFLDLRDERDALSNLFREFGIDVLALDAMPSSGDSPQKVIAQGITKSDLVILIFGSRYGALLNETRFIAKNRDTCSVTKWEYLLARDKQKTILTFIKDTTYDQNEKSQNPLKEALFRSFKSEFDHVNKQYFSNAIELKTKVIQSIIAYLHNSKNGSLHQLKAENESLKKEINTLQEKLIKQSYPVHGFQSSFTSLGNNSLLGLGDYKPKQK